MRDFTFHHFSFFNPYIASLLDKHNLSPCLYLKTASSIFSFCKFWFNPGTDSSAFSIPPLIMLHKITGLQSSSLDMPLAHPTLPCMPKPGRLHLVNPVTCICIEARLSTKHHCFDLISLTIAMEFYLNLNILLWIWP